MIPIILGGIAAVTAISGIKKGVDAKNDYDRAERIVNRAKKTFREKKNELEEYEENLKQNVNEYGDLKVSVYLNVLRNKFLPIFQRFGGVASLSKLEDNPEVINNTVENIYANVDIAEKIRSGAVEGIAKGALGGASVAAGAWGLAGAIGVASTGTALSTLSGAALTSATSAWLGGGALAAGGLGMAGGAAILGGLVAGPLIAITGFTMAHKAEEAYYQARDYEDEIDLKCEQINEMLYNYKAIDSRIEELTGIILELTDRLKSEIQDLGNNYTSIPYPFATRLFRRLIRKSEFHISEDDTKKLHSIYYLAKSIKQIFDTPLIKDDGTLSQQSGVLALEN